MSYFELRKKFKDFFEEKNHSFLASASLVPENDPSTLFTTAGMQPLVPYLLGKEHPRGNRLASIQKCIRTGDIEEVGDSSHLTFFEMMGNWSLNDYFKKESISWSWEFLTDFKWLGLDKKKFSVSVFMGDEDAPFDEESYNIWKDIFDKEGISEKRISKLGKSDNWWPAGGKMPGPQGPDTEIFYWTGEGDIPEFFDPEDSKWLEVWNNVFMEYSKKEGEELVALDNRNVDTGMGMERILKVVQEKNDVFETELFQSIIKKIEELSGLKYGEKKDEEYIKEGLECWVDTRKQFRIVADHLKASFFILSEGIEPSNTGAGYVLRRLIRRAIRYGNLMGIKGSFVSKIAEINFEIYNSVYPELEEKKDFILKQLDREEDKFIKTLEKGIKKLKNILDGIDSDSCSFDECKLPGKDAFYLYQSYGFPIELTRELSKERGFEIDEEEFEKELSSHQEKSRTASEGMFKGGLSGQSEKEVRYHTATHMLQAALKKVLGEEVEQRGSNITGERLRFDFLYGQKMTDEQKKKVEDLVNEKIKEGLDIKKEEMSVEEAKEVGAVGIFDDKYGDKVSVYTIFNPETKEVFSREICGGPHVKNTNQLGNFRIKKEESVSSGVRRIKAVLY